VTLLTETEATFLLQNTPMKRVGLCQTLVASVDLANALDGSGENKHFRSKSLLFHAGDKNEGVFLVCSGKVCLRVPGGPHLDRMFSTGSVLGLPSTFSGNPYSLTAACVTQCDVAHVGGKKFLHLMKAHPDLCREATDMLSREVAFLLSALRQYPPKVLLKDRKRLRLANRRP
jgi:CRP-like cAMP-binding protein